MSSISVKQDFSDLTSMPEGILDVPTEEKLERMIPPCVTRTKKPTSPYEGNRLKVYCQKITSAKSLTRKHHSKISCSVSGS